jgi:hypothetical protein
MSQTYGRSLDTPLSSTQYQDKWAPSIPDQLPPGLAKWLKDRKSHFFTKLKRPPLVCNDHVL